MDNFVSLLVPKKLLLPPPVVVPAAPPVDVEAIRAEATAHGRREALAEMETELTQARAALDLLPELVDALTRARREALDRAAADVTTLLSAALHKVLGDHLVHRPEVLLRIVLDAVARIEGEEAVVIRVPPGSADFLRANLPERHQGNLRADPLVEAGVIVDATHATIEVSVSTITAGLDEAMRTWLEGRG